ncbi:hypothetical protein P8452_43287 [Trifolium repens]|nr:hypothetical protein P8452_43287 [Trifolium repens]
MSSLLGHNTPLGHNTENTNENNEKHDEEKDLQERSTKKKKEGDHSFSNNSSLPKDYSDAMDMQVTGGSYRDTVLGRNRHDKAEVRDGEEEEGEEEEQDEGEGMKVEERVIGDYECPEFIFSKRKRRDFTVRGGGVLL